MDLWLLRVDNLSQLIVLDFLAGEFLFKFLNIISKLIQHQKLLAPKLNIIEPSHQQLEGIIIDMTDLVVVISQNILDQIKRDGRIGVSGADVEIFGRLSLYLKFKVDDLEVEGKWGFEGFNLLSLRGIFRLADHLIFINNKIWMVIYSDKNKIDTSYCWIWMAYWLVIIYQKPIA